MIAALDVLREAAVDAIAASLADERRILARVCVRGPFCCWIWKGATAKNPRGGYGKAKVRGRAVRVHRWLWAQLLGAPAPDLLDHLCHNRRCCNPGHLQPSTVAENTKAGLSGVRRSEWRRARRKAWQ